MYLTILIGLDTRCCVSVAQTDLANVVVGNNHVSHHELLVTLATKETIINIPQKVVIK